MCLPPILLLVVMFLPYVVHKQYQMVEVNNQNKSQKETYWWKNEVLYCKNVECRLSARPKSLDVC
jgi:hypothetical protein